jgi:hypothetical protein
VNDREPIAAQEAVAVTQAALALGGHRMDRFTYELITKIGRGELTGDQAAEAVISHFLRISELMEETMPPVTRSCADGLVPALSASSPRRRPPRNSGDMTATACHARTLWKKDQSFM